MRTGLEGIEPIIGTERPRIWRFSTPAGPTRSKFLTGLRDNKTITGTRCAVCNRVYVPARSPCPRCMKDLDEWVDVSSKGTLLSYTVVYRPEPVHPAEPPLIYAIIKLDGADTGLVHMLAALDLEKLTIGMRVQAVFKEARVGDIRDIRYFKPLV